MLKYMLGCSIGASDAQPTSASSPTIATRARVIQRSPTPDPPGCRAARPKDHALIQRFRARSWQWTNHDCREALSRKALVACQPWLKGERSPDFRRLSALVPTHHRENDGLSTRRAHPAYAKFVVWMPHSVLARPRQRPARTPPWKRLRPLIQALNGARARFSGSTLRIRQHASGSENHNSRF